MPESTFASSAGLPHEGQLVEFALDGRAVMINGTYASRIFRSRWSGYGMDRVFTWRPANGGSMQAQAQACA